MLFESVCIALFYPCLKVRRINRKEINLEKINMIKKFEIYCLFDAYVYIILINYIVKMNMLNICDYLNRGVSLFIPGNKTNIKVFPSTLEPFNYIYLKGSSVETYTFKYI